MSDLSKDKVPPVKFKSRNGTLTFLFKNGKAANFIGGEYITEHKWEIDELQGEIATSHPFIYIDENDATGESAEAKLEGLKNSMREQILAEIAAESLTKKNPEALDPNNISTKLAGIGNSATVGAGAVDSSSGASASAVAKG